MGKTRIEWATHSWNPITGCSHAGSPGCDHCYAARLAATRLKHHPHYIGLAEMVNGHPRWTGEVRFNEDVLQQPLHWRKRRVVFLCSMSDWLHPSIPQYRRCQLFDVMAACPRHTFLLLTKRPEIYQGIAYFDGEHLSTLPLPNVWQGVTVETRDQLWRLEQLVRIPAARYWVSLEPLLGPVVIPPELLAKLSGLVVGGESGPRARPMGPDWARKIRDDGVAAGVPFTLKQWGEWMGLDRNAELSEYTKQPAFNWSGYPMPPFLPGESFRARHEFDDETAAGLIGKRRAGRMLDGKIWDEFPWNLLKDDAELGLGGPREGR